MLMLIVPDGTIDNVCIVDLNTSHVNVNLFHQELILIPKTNLNTSHVNVNHKRKRILQIR